MRILSLWMLGFCALSFGLDQVHNQSQLKHNPAFSEPQQINLILISILPGALECWINMAQGQNKCPLTGEPYGIVRDYHNPAYTYRFCQCHYFVECGMTEEEGLYYTLTEYGVRVNIWSYYQGVINVVAYDHDMKSELPIIIKTVGANSSIDGQFSPLGQFFVSGAGPCYKCPTTNTTNLPTEGSTCDLTGCMWKKEGPYWTRGEPKCAGFTDRCPPTDRRNNCNIKMLVSCEYYIMCCGEPSLNCGDPSAGCLNRNQHIIFTGNQRNQHIHPRNDCAGNPCLEPAEWPIINPVNTLY